MALSDYASAISLITGALFFLAGSIGLLRLPDLYSRLHALTKADNTGLGFIILGLAFQAESWLEILKLALIWLLVLFASASSSFLIAGNASGKGAPFWKR